MPKIKLYDGETICAIATPSGEGGVHIVRLSGEDAVLVSSKIFRFKNSKLTFENLRPNSIHYGVIIDDEKEVDEGMLSYFKAPFSYTREDVIEINVHGNYALANYVLKLMLKNGARLADAGEFTKRAFLNGRLDLSQAEAVYQLISAKTEKGCQVAFDQLRGKLSHEIMTFKDHVLDILAEVEAFVDFPEEDIEIYEDIEIVTKLSELIEGIAKILTTYEQGEILRSGVQAVIIGKPNVGKSSLMNTLLKRDRAIVSDIPGTTRDSLEEWLDIQGVIFRIIDTAGIRDGTDQIESLGVERAQNYIQQAQLCLFVLDQSRDWEKEDQKIWEQIRNKPKIYIFNKSDLAQKIDMEKVLSEKGSPFVCLSTLQKSGIEELEEKMVQSVWKGDISDNHIILNSQRQYDVLSKTNMSLKKAQKAFSEKLSLEFIAFDLRDALESLGEVVGEIYSDDVLGVIFSKFCIGK